MTIKGLKIDNKAKYRQEMLKKTALKVGLMPKYTKPTVNYFQLVNE